MWVSPLSLSPQGQLSTHALHLRLRDLHPEAERSIRDPKLRLVSRLQFPILGPVPEDLADDLKDLLYSSTTQVIR